MLDVFCFHFSLSSILFTFCLQHTTGSSGTMIRVLFLEKSCQTLWVRTRQQNEMGGPFIFEKITVTATVECGLAKG